MATTKEKPQDTQICYCPANRKDIHLASLAELSVLAFTGLILSIDSWHTTSVINIIQLALLNTLHDSYKDIH